MEDIFLEYAPIRRDHAAPLNDASNEKNAAEIATLRDLLTFFGTRDARALDYWMDNSLFSNWKKTPEAFPVK